MKEGFGLIFMEVAARCKPFVAGMAGGELCRVDQLRVLPWPEGANLRQLVCSPGTGWWNHHDQQHTNASLDNSYASA
jgi:hypothetical protein